MNLDQMIKLKYYNLNQRKSKKWRRRRSQLNKYKKSKMSQKKSKRRKMMIIWMEAISEMMTLSTRFTT